MVLAAPSFNGVLKDFQHAPVDFFLEKERVIIGDQIGLGKSWEFLYSVEAGDLYPCLLIVPSQLREMWADFCDDLLPHRYYQVVNTRKDIIRKDNEFLIISYDMLATHIPNLVDIQFKSVGADESHYLRYEKSQRSHTAVEFVQNIKYRCLLTGTPVYNNPKDMVPQLEFLDRMDDFGGKRKFNKDYINNEDANLVHLHHQLKKHCYIRRTATEVGLKLPERETNIYDVPLTNRETYNYCEENLIDWLKANVSEGAAHRASKAEQIAKICYLKQVASRGKLQFLNNWTTNFLRHSDEKIIIAADQIATQQAMMSMFPTALHIFANDSRIARRKAKDSFQKDPNCRLMIASLKSTNVGLTLTAGTHIGFAELGWNHATHSQFEGRIYRIGQERKCHFHYFNAPNTIDDPIWDIIQRKRTIEENIEDGINTEPNFNFVNDLIYWLTNK